jgi:hypothetical protein
LYEDDLIHQFESQCKGCTVKNVFRRVFKQMTCYFCPRLWQDYNRCMVCVMNMVLNITFFNLRKSHCIKIGKHFNCTVTGMLLHDVVIEWVDGFKYLGIVFNTGVKLRLDCSQVKRRFFNAVNSVLCKCKYADEIMRLHLVTTFCLPKLVYCTGATGCGA